MNKKKVLVIGSGERAQSAIFPALWCLRDTHELVGVYGRSRKMLSLMNGQMHIETTDSLQDISLSEIDIIMAAVTKENVPQFLKDISAYDTKHIVLMLDTPVLPPTKLLATRYFKNFKRVTISEDIIALPPFLLARALIDQGRIGTLKKIYFFHNGYKYHATASLKMLSGNTRAGWLIGRKFYNGIMQKEFHFPNGVKAVLFEPRDYEKGHMLIEGTEGTIADYAYKGGPHIRIEYLRDGNIYTGLVLDGVPQAHDELDKKYLAGITHDIAELSLMNSMKLRGLMDLIVAATKDTSPYHYKPLDGIFDNLVMITGDKLGFGIDPRL